MNQAQKLTPPALGTYWQGQGGIYVGDVRGENGAPNYHLILPTDPAARIAEIAWGPYGTEIEGARSMRDGFANTAAMAAAGLELATRIQAIEIEGHNDFYLPALLETSLCNLNGGEDLDQDYWHWTSTQCSAHSAWVTGFEDGFQGPSTKGYEFSAQAVRRLII